MDLRINVLIVYRKTREALCNEENNILYETKPTKLSKT